MNPRPHPPTPSRKEGSNLHYDLTKVFGREVCSAVNQLISALKEQGKSLTAYEVDGKKVDVIYMPTDKVTKI